MNFEGSEVKRRVASFGYNWSFERRVLSSGKEIPKDFERLIVRVSNYIKILRNIVQELLIAEYRKDSVINS